MINHLVPPYYCLSCTGSIDSGLTGLAKGCLQKQTCPASSVIILRLHASVQFYIGIMMDDEMDSSQYDCSLQIQPQIYMYICTTKINRQYLCSLVDFIYQ